MSLGQMFPAVYAAAAGSACPPCVLLGMVSKGQERNKSCARQAVRGHTRKMLSWDAQKNSFPQPLPSDMAVALPGAANSCTQVHPTPGAGLLALESLSLSAGQLSPESPHNSCTCISHTVGQAGSDPEVPRALFPGGY